MEKDVADKLDRLWEDEVLLHRAKEKRNISHTIQQRNANWIGHILRRNCLLKHVIERKIEGTGKRGGRRQQLLDDIKERRIFLISNLRCVLNVVFFLLGDSQASEFYMPTFRNTVSSIFNGGINRKNLLAYTAYEGGTDSVPKRRHIKFRSREITQKKEYKGEYNGI